MEDLLHEGFHFDVDTHAALIDARVLVECLDQRNYSGRVYTIDPLTQTFVSRDSINKKVDMYSVDSSLVLIDETCNRVHVVLRPDILQLKILDRHPSSTSPMKDPFFVSSSSSASLPSNEQRDPNATVGNDLNSIRSFLSSKRIPFQERIEENESVTLLIQNGIVQICAPYRPENISGTNEIVLSRIKQLLKAIVR